MTAPTGTTLAFAGTGTFAAAVLAGLQDRALPLALVVTPPDRARNPGPVAALAAAANLPRLAPQRIAEINATLATLDLLVVADYGQIIPLATLRAPRRGALNVHPSLLPRYRGPTPIQTALLNGDSETGVSVMVLDEEVDHGPIVAQRRLSLTGRETTPQLEATLAAAGAALLADNLAPYLAEKLLPQPQDHARATYTKRLTRTDGQLDWSQSATALERRVRALQPWPGVWFEALLRGSTKRCKLITTSRWVADVPLLPAGTFFWDAGHLGLTCTGGALEVAELQVEGGRVLDADAFYRGYHDVIRTVTPTTPARP